MILTGLPVPQHPLSCDVLRSNEDYIVNGLVGTARQLFARLLLHHAKFIKANQPGGFGIMSSKEIADMFGATSHLIKDRSGDILLD